MYPMLSIDNKNYHYIIFENPKVCFGCFEMLISIKRSCQIMIQNFIKSIKINRYFNSFSKSFFELTIFVIFKFLHDRIISKKRLYYEKFKDHIYFVKYGDMTLHMTKSFI